MSMWCVCSYNANTLGFPRMPASVVTTCSHLAAARFLRGKDREAFYLISFHLLYNSRLNNLKRVPIPSY